MSVVFWLPRTPSETLLFFVEYGLIDLYERNGSVESIKKIIKGLNDAKLDSNTGKTPSLCLARLIGKA